MLGGFSVPYLTLGGISIILAVNLHMWVFGSLERNSDDQYVPITETNGIACLSKKSLNTFDMFQVMIMSHKIKFYVMS